MYSVCIFAIIIVHGNTFRKWPVVIIVTQRLLECFAFGFDWWSARAFSLFGLFLLPQCNFYESGLPFFCVSLRLFRFCFIRNVRIVIFFLLSIFLFKKAFRWLACVHWWKSVCWSKCQLSVNRTPLLRPRQILTPKSLMFIEYHKLRKKNFYSLFLEYFLLIEFIQLHTNFNRN